MTWATWRQAGWGANGNPVGCESQIMTILLFLQLLRNKYHMGYLVKSWLGRKWPRCRLRASDLDNFDSRAASEDQVQHGLLGGMNTRS